MDNGKALIRCSIGPLLQKLRFPVADQVGVDAEYAGQLGDGFLALDGLSSFWGPAQKTQKSQVSRMF